MVQGVGRSGILIAALAAFAGCGVGGQQPGEIGISEQALGVPITLLDLRYDADRVGIAPRIEMPVGIWNAARNGTDFALHVEFSYSSSGEPVKVESTTSLSTVQTRRVLSTTPGTVIVEPFVAGPPPDDIASILPCFELSGPAGTVISRSDDEAGPLGAAPTPHP